MQCTNECCDRNCGVFKLSNTKTGQLFYCGNKKARIVLESQIKEFYDFGFFPPISSQKKTMLSLIYKLEEGEYELVGERKKETLNLLGMELNMDHPIFIKLKSKMSNEECSFI